MLIGIVSDTHDRKVGIEWAITLFNEERVGAVLHAGDIASASSALLFMKLECPFYAVAGNCDHDTYSLEKALAGWAYWYGSTARICLEGHEILLIHRPEDIPKDLSGMATQIVIHGHTHKQQFEKKDGYYFINPGSIGGMKRQPYSLALLDTSKMEVRFVMEESC
jgi:putative phosphoesterase